MNKAFISYAHADASVEASALARALSFAGVRPWQDERSLLLGKKIQSDIAHAIRSECRGGLIWLSSAVAASRFMREVELPLLLERAEAGGFALVPVFVDVRPGETQPLIGDAGARLADYNGVVVESDDDVAGKIWEASLDYVRAHVHLLAGGDRPLVRAVTRFDSAPAADVATLDFDWREPFADGVPDPITRLELATALATATGHLLEAFGSGEAEISLKTHLSVAIAIGHALRRTTGAVPHGTHEDIVWKAVATTPTGVEALRMTRDDDAAGLPELAIEVSISRSVGPGVDQFIDERGAGFRARLRFEPTGRPDQPALSSSEEANAWAEQIVAEAIRVKDDIGVSAMSLFIAAPIPVAVLLGWRMNVSGPVTIYEWLGNTGPYVPLWKLP